MADTWFRIYNTAVHHHKTLTLTDAQFRAWVHVLSLASEMGGELPYNVPLIAKALGKSQGKTVDLIQVLQSAALLDPLEGGGWKPHNWDKRQFKSDVSTERVKRFRDKKGNVSVTDHRQRTETDTEKKKRKDALSRFKEFWAICPKKTDLAAAEKAWAKAILLAEPDVLIAAMKRYAESEIGKDRTYTKTPGPWLNNKKWLDEGIAPAAAPDAVEVYAARSEWGGEAAKLVDEIGLPAFTAYFKAVQFEPGPPAHFGVSTPMMRDLIERKFAAPLRRAYGEVILELAA